MAVPETPFRRELRDEELSLRPEAVDGGVAFAIERAGAGAGSVRVELLGDRVGEVSWQVDPAHRRQGLATRAVGIVIDRCFAEFGLARVLARIRPDDIASLRTAARAGLRREGVARADETTGGRRVDHVVLARLADDPEPDTPDGFRAILNAALPMKHVIAQGLIRSTAGRVLLCELTYKREWDLPGGIVDPGESPATALIREIREELGLESSVRGLRLANWLPPWHGWDDAMLLVFDLGIHDESIADGLTLEEREIRGVHWCDGDTAMRQVAPYLAELLPTLMTQADGPIYREAGRPLGS